MILTFSKTYVYNYDNAGNLLTKVTYALTAEGVTPTSPISTVTYTYSTGAWGDQLTAYNGHAITYDANGNPLTYYNGATFTWVGRQLKSASYNGFVHTFTYNVAIPKRSVIVSGQRNRPKQEAAEPSVPR